MENELQEFPSELAKLNYERLLHARSSLIEEHSANYRWLLASLLVLNSGGLFGILDKRFDEAYLLASAIAFWAGIALALLTGWLGQVQTRRFVKANAQIEEQWAIAASTGFIDAEKVQTLESEQKSIGTTAPRWVGVASFVAFSIGLSLFGWGYLHLPPVLAC